MKELVGDGPGAVDGAHVGSEDVLVADGFGVLDLVHVEIFATEPVPESLAPDGAPGEGALLSGEREEVLHGADAGEVEALLHAGADAGEVAEFEALEGARENVWGEGDEAVGLVHVGGDLGEVAVGGESDGAAEGVADFFFDAGFDLAAEFHGDHEGTLATDEAAAHLVDGVDAGDGEAAFNGFDDAVVEFDVELVAGFDELDLGTEAAGVGDDGAGFDAEGLGFVTGGDATGGFGHHGENADGLATELGTGLLLDTGEVGVEVDKEPTEERSAADGGEAGSEGAGVGSGGGFHSGMGMSSHRIYFRFLFSIVQH